MRQRMAEAVAKRWPGPAMRVERFALVQSKLKSTGPEYAAVAHFPLES